MTPVASEVWNQDRLQVPNHLQRQVLDQVWNQVWHQISDQFREQNYGLTFELE